jgi:adenylate cyclase
MRIRKTDWTQACEGCADGNLFDHAIRCLNMDLPVSRRYTCFMPEKVQRRLAAIIAADVAGYTRLMRLDEESTMAAWWSCRREVIDPVVAEHGGRVVKLTGDGFLAEFSSATDAVSAALAMQTEIGSRAVDVPVDKQVLFRMGINLGDILWDDEDIYGDGVNIAARIEALADPGGILVSASVHDQVHHRLPLAFVDMGEQALKNIDLPVKVYRVDGYGQGVGLAGQDSTARLLPDKPSIAVLPFDNMSGDPEQEYFADGIAEDIITELSRFRDLFIVARNSTFQFKGGAVDIKGVARELGVRYVVEGSVRKSGNRVRITAQLIEAESGAHIWADRYDRELTDIFAVQDEVTVSIVTAIAPRSVDAARRRSREMSDQDLNSWDLTLQAIALLGKYEKQNNARAIELLERAIKVDPANARAHARLSYAVLIGSGYGWVDDIKAARKRALDEVKMAVDLDPDDAESRALLAAMFAYFENDVDAGLAELTVALKLNPNVATAHATLGGIHALRGDLKSSAACLEKALTLSPRDEFIPQWLVNHNMGVISAGNYEEAVEIATRAIRTHSEYPAAWRQRAVALALSGHLDEAKADIARVLELIPGNSIAEVREQAFFFPIWKGLSKA